jgi:hypothetical protein
LLSVQSKAFCPMSVSITRFLCFPHCPAFTLQDTVIHYPSAFRGRGWLQATRN